MQNVANNAISVASSRRQDAEALRRLFWDGSNNRTAKRAKTRQPVTSLPLRAANFPSVGNCGRAFWGTA